MKRHWDAVYAQKLPGQVSWYQPHLALSLRLLKNAGLSPESRVIDIGGGASTLVDDLLARGVKHLTVLDISGRALAASKARLGARAADVEWIEGDVTQVTLPAGGVDLWHDRAVFHFLTDAGDRRRYVEAMHGALRPGGQAIMATFSLQGPPKCSGLEVRRYSPGSLSAELGDGFRLLESAEETHQTPFKTTQAFTYCRFQKLPSPPIGKVG